MGQARAIEDCPSDEALAAFALGRLDETQRALLEAHLDACATCQLLAAEAAHAETLAAAVTTPAGTHTDLDWNTTFPRGTLVGRRYEIRRFIARGGMGEVYEAFDRVLGERVALKTVTATASDDVRAVRRLKAEVQLARLVSHPNVCRIYDLGTHALPGGRAELHFLTMQFVEGETLGQRVRLAGALPFVEAEKLARELLLALRAAHDAGVLHRDFKSDNVMLKAAPDGLSTAVVLDFGLARGLAQEPRPSASNPNVVGTVGYIAPEHFEGMGYSIASDLFSFGVVWYEMLTGHLPFETPSTSRAAPTERRLTAVPGPVPPPSSLNPEVPKPLDALVLRCLERAPERRFESVGALLDAIDRASAGPRVRHRRALLAASLVVSGVLGAAAYLALRAPNGGAAPDLAETHAVMPEQHAPVAELVPTAPVLIPAVAVTKVDAAARTLAPANERAAVPPAFTPPRVARAPRAAPRRLDETASSPARPAAPPSFAHAVSAPAAPSAAPLEPAPPLRAPVEPKKPDWENPFGVLERAELGGGSQSPT